MSVRSDAGQQPLRSALKTEDDGDRTPPASGSLKAVQIADPVSENYIDDDGLSIKQFKTGHGRRMSGRLPPAQLPGSSRSSTYEGSPSLRPQDDDRPHFSSHHHQHKYYSEKLLSQVGEWLEHQKTKQKNRKKSHRRRKSASPSNKATDTTEKAARARADSIDSQSSDASLDKLQRILENNMMSMGLNALPQYSPKVSRSRHRKTPSRTSMHRTASSDTDYVDGDAIVPECDAWLDNTKTLGYGGNPPSTPGEVSERAEKEKEAWLKFKNDIIRIAHTLRIKGWRRVPLEGGDLIDVERLSGALTNAVYVVTPPADLNKVEGKKPPNKLLLRIYGPQVENLIDRDNELMVLQRLARKKIGPRLLGTFKNGRFEQFFKAVALTPTEFRDPDVSKQIAKRMRELHDGIELLDDEREGGPTVWKNWNSWVDNVGRIMSFLDAQVGGQDAHPERRQSVLHAWKTKGYVCGVPFPQFKEMVEKYRDYVESFYESKQHLNNDLVFAHNDTQYGNILRFQVDDAKSPLLQAANKHKQLIVIDFEYAAANTRGQEFANHFTEWAYNYHHPTESWACNTRAYPTLDEQHRFLKAYVEHRPQFPHASSTPKLTPRDDATPGSVTPSLLPTNSSSSIVDFMLDSRAPPGGWSAAERAREEQTDHQVRELLDETRLWRPINSVFWIAWGIVQARVPGLDGVEDEDGGVDDFDYLSYAQDRALFFWGDCVKLGLVKLEDLPEQMRSRIKVVEY